MFPQRSQHDTEDFIKSAVRAYRGGDDYDSAVRNTITGLMMKVVVPWLNKCFEKYDEYDFHVRMSEGFSFVSDWQQNHRRKYGSFIMVSRHLYRTFHITLDEEQVMQNVLQLLSSRGWILYQEEIDRMRDDLFAVRAEIEGHPLE